MADPLGTSEPPTSDVAPSNSSPSPKPFDASLFDQGDADKPVSPSFPVESPFMALADPPPTRMEAPTSQALSGSGEETVQGKVEDPAGNDTPAAAAAYFTSAGSLTQSSGSFFDSFASARADENNLFSTPPSSMEATPLSPEGLGFAPMEESLGGTPDDPAKSAEAAEGNSETVSMDSTNLLTEGDAKLGSGSNIDTMSMDSTNLLSEEDKDDQSVDPGNDSFDAKNEQLDEELKRDTNSDGTMISLESPDTETPPGSENPDANQHAGGESTLLETMAHSDDQTPASTLNAQLDMTNTEVLVQDIATEGTDSKSSDVSQTLSSAATDERASFQSPISATPPSSASSQEDTTTESSESIGGVVPPPLLSSFSAPSGLSPLAPLRPRAPFESTSSQDGDDPFVAALRDSEMDRRHDAWIPAEAVQKILDNRSIALQGSEYVIRDQLTMPGILAEEPQGDPVRDLMQRYMGEQEAAKRSVLTVNQVTRDESGLKRLLDAGCLRAAIDLTGLLLTAGGQGKGQAGMPSRHTPQLMQIWFTRISLFMKLQQFTAAEQEVQAFGNLDKPDLFYGYYPDLYPGRKGSIIPFSFRVIHAELPMYLGKHQLCLDRLSAILSVCQRIIQNLEEGKSEYGQFIELSDDNRKASLDLWKSREVRILHSVGNCLVSMKEYMQAVNVFKSLMEKEPENKINILCGIARVYLQLGDLKSAQDVYTDVEKKITGQGSKDNQARIHLNRGFLKVAQNQYAEAYKHFNESLKIDPNNFMAINNLSVCCLYLGRLKEALSVLEGLVKRDGAQCLDESLVFNLCTLYELESSRSITRKQTLLSMIGKHRGDGFSVSCLKMP